MASSEVSIKGNSVNGKAENSSGGFNGCNDVRNAGGELQNASSSSSARDAETALYRELWHACAGPLVTVPREGERVFYFPQGHIEQVVQMRRYSAEFRFWRCLSQADLVSTVKFGVLVFSIFGFEHECLFLWRTRTLGGSVDKSGSGTAYAGLRSTTEDPLSGHQRHAQVSGYGVIPQRRRPYVSLWIWMIARRECGGEGGSSGTASPVSRPFVLTSPAEFIVPYDQYMESLKNNYTIGMRFKMRFEGEEAPEQRFTGTIVGIEDADQKRWPNSKWRSLKVRWDETSNVPRPERVSQWKIEPALAPPALNPLPMPRPKRPRSNVVPSSPDSSVLTREASSKVSVDPLPASGFQRVLQGQELSTLRVNFAESNESDTAEKSAWSSAADDEKIDVVSTSRRYGSESWMSMGRHEPTYPDLLSGFGVHGDQASHPSLVDQNGPVANLSRKHFFDREGKHNVLSPWPVVPSSLSLNLLDSNTKVSAQGGDQVRGNLRFSSAFGDYTVLHGHKVDHSHGNFLMPPPLSTQYESPRSRELLPKPISGKPSEVSKPKDSDCKLFGISLLSSPIALDPSVLQRNVAIEPVGHMHTTHQQRTYENDPKSENSRGSKPADGVLIDDHEKPAQTSQPQLKDVQPKSNGGSARSCTKVHKKGIALGRSVDLTKFSAYDELIAELDELFEFGGELTSPQKDWLIVYTDNEGDMMLVGDDPWQEFVAMVRKIYIYPKEEIQKMSPGTLSSRNEENQSASEGADAQQENKCQLNHSASEA
ncbi:Auxin response factor [Vigna angularis]|uniref:Auxin-induced protein n=1 Tax=Phaseolus angularis TaxID=3914 RepID=A0A8T0LJ94_PHAAN|nr:Auxin response factor [Vigna angularis]